MATVIMGFFVFLFVMFILREVFTWYTKQSRIVEQNDEIIWLLRKIAGERLNPSNKGERIISDLEKQIKEVKGKY